MEVDPLLEALPSMLPGLFEAFNDSNADVRKAVVFCLVRPCFSFFIRPSTQAMIALCLSIRSTKLTRLVWLLGCQVDIYMVLGPQFEAHLGELNASQLRLVRIYINRMNKARNERAAASATAGLDQPNALGES